MRASETCHGVVRAGAGPKILGIHNNKVSGLTAMCGTRFHSPETKAGFLRMKLVGMGGYG